MRLKNIDLLRGIVMIFMCIDHARDYTMYHPADPMNLKETDIIVYILRILAHFCAPTFILLAGISARLSGIRKTKKELSLFLLERGVILCLLEITLVNWAWSFNPAYSLVFLQVIWAIGLSMVMLSLLILLKDKIILIISITILVGHNLLDKIHFPENSLLHYLWSFLLQKNVLPITENFSVRTTYPVLPVLGVMALGYVIGSWYVQKEILQRKKYLLMSSAAMFVLFILFRVFIGYGDPYAWDVTDNWKLTVMSLFNVTKYPFSLQFVLLTVTVTLLFLGVTDNKSYERRNYVISLGQTPMFFYILHIYILHAFGLLYVMMQGITPDFNTYLGGIPYNVGYPFWWLLWTVPLTIIILIPLCVKYQKLKKSNKYKITRYI